LRTFPRTLWHSATAFDEFLVDIIELGTPLINSEGLAMISAIKAAHPDEEVFADLKPPMPVISKLISPLPPVPTSSPFSTRVPMQLSWARWPQQASTERRLSPNLIGGAVRFDRARELSKLGVAFVELHVGLDEQAQPGYSNRGAARRRSGSGSPVLKPAA
jgi:3-hexulose-6-phosphate synthase